MRLPVPQPVVPGVRRHQQVGPQRLYRSGRRALARARDHGGRHLQRCHARRPLRRRRLSTYDKMDIYAGPRYEYAEGSTIWVILGNSWISPEDGDRETQGFWDVGITHRFLSYTLTLNAALTYIDDPQLIVRRQDRYTATFQKNTERWTLAATVGRLGVPGLPDQAPAGHAQRPGRHPGLHASRTPSRTPIRSTSTGTRTTSSAPTRCSI